MGYTIFQHPSELSTQWLDHLPGLVGTNSYSELENGHWNSEFSREKMWFSIVYQRVICLFAVIQSRWNVDWLQTLWEHQLMSGEHKKVPDVGWFWCNNPGIPMWTDPPAISLSKCWPSLLQKGHKGCVLQCVKGYRQRYFMHRSRGTEDGMGRLPGLVNIQKTMERSTIFNGKIHYKWPFSIAFCMFTRG